MFLTIGTAEATDIDFNAVRYDNGAFTGYTESGFTVSPLTTGWSGAM